MSRRVLIDAGPLVALLSAHDQHHAACTEAARDLPAVLFTSLPALTEAAHLASRYGGLSSRTVLAAVRSGNLEVLPIERGDLLAIDGILQRYAEHGFSIADASLMHLADREGIEEVFTIDHQDFNLFRTAGGRALKLVG